MTNLRPKDEYRGEVFQDSKMGISPWGFEGNTGWECIPLNDSIYRNLITPMHTRLLAFSLLLMSVACSFGWSMPGHMIVTAFAYSELSPEEQAQIDTILKDHVFSGKWDDSYPSGDFAVSRPLYRSLLACLYPDEIRDYSKPETFAYWHFVDYPLRPPDYPLEARPTPQNDVIYGIDQSEQAIENEPPGADRGKMMSFLLHLVGDIHQPLHCEATFTVGFTTDEGDKGANYVYVSAPEQPDLGLKGGKINLHAFWDELFGTGGNPMRFPSPTVVLAAVHKADALKQQFKRQDLPELATDTTPTAWSIESRTKAINDALLGGKLKYSPAVDQEEKAKAPPGTVPAIDADYVKHAHEVADRCVALAGYRLADELHRVLAAEKANGGQGNPNAPHFDPVSDKSPSTVHSSPSSSPTDSRVWVNTRSGVYWKEGSEFYGQTKQGKYMTESEAISAGFRPGKGQ